MNYLKIYNNLINKARNRDSSELIGFTNKHHIVPKYKGGSNNSENLAILTYKEHIFAHKLLYQIYGNKYDLYAYLLMSSKNEEAALLIKKMGGAVSGRINANNGHLDRIRPTGEKQREYSRRAGLKNVESGHIIRLAKKNSKLGALCRSLKSKFTYIDNLGNEYNNIKTMMEQYPESPKNTLVKRCIKNIQGWSRRRKTEEEILANNKIVELLKLRAKNNELS